MTIGVLCVAEKPSLAASIAQHLSHGSCSTRRSHQDVHEFTSTWLGQSAEIKVTSVIGHVYNTDFDGQYQDWCANPSLVGALVARPAADPAPYPAAAGSPLSGLASRPRARPLRCRWLRH